MEDRGTVMISTLRNGKKSRAVLFGRKKIVSFRGLIDQVGMGDINEINIDNIIDFDMPRPYKNHANSINVVADKIKKMWAKIQANAKS